MDWKIQRRELAMMKLCRFVICACRFFFGIEQPKVNQFVAAADLRFPFAALAGNAPVATCTYLWSVAVRGVLRVIAFAQVCSLVVQRVVVAMIHKDGIVDAENLPGHANEALIHRVTRRVKTLGVLTPVGNPIPLTEPLKISRIHKRVLAASKWDQAVGFVQGLHDFMSANMAFGHAVDFNTGGALCPG